VVVRLVLALAVGAELVEVQRKLPYGLGEDPDTGKHGRVLKSPKRSDVHARRGSDLDHPPSMNARIVGSGTARLPSELVEDHVASALARSEGEHHREDPAHDPAGGGA
jgi:hypothetical protein